MRSVARCIILLFVMMNFTVSARNYSDAEKRASLITQWMEKKLGLTEMQITKIQVLNLKCEQEIEKLTIEKEGFPCMQAVRDSLMKKEAEFKEVLTQQQLASYLKCRCELKEELKKQFGTLN